MLWRAVLWCLTNWHSSQPYEQEVSEAQLEEETYLVRSPANDPRLLLIKLEREIFWGREISSTTPGIGKNLVPIPKEHNDPSELSLTSRDECLSAESCSTSGRRMRMGWENSSEDDRICAGKNERSESNRIISATIREAIRTFIPKPSHPKDARRPSSREAHFGGVVSGWREVMNEDESQYRPNDHRPCGEWKG
jgi:hypothetical protein